MALRSRVTLAATVLLFLPMQADIQAAPQSKSKAQQTKEAVQAQPKLDPKAGEHLRKMSNYMAGLKGFSVKADHETEVVLKNGQKLEFNASSEIFVERPNRVRADRRGEIVAVSTYYDGDTLTLYGPDTGYYVREKAPPTIDQTIEFMQERGLDLPGSDLLFSQPYKVLMEDVVSSMYIGKSTVRGVPVHHLAFRGNETDWQIWIEDSATPRPLKYVITTKNTKGQPEFAVELHDWDENARMPAEFFTFVPPDNAERIDFFKHRKQKQESQQKEK